VQRQTFPTRDSENGQEHRDRTSQINAIEDQHHRQQFQINNVSKQKVAHSFENVTGWQCPDQRMQPLGKRIDRIVDTAVRLYGKNSSPSQTSCTKPVA